MGKKRAVIMFRMDPPAGKEKEWNKWYNEEHIPSRLKLPGYLAIRRFEISAGLPDKFVVPGPKYMIVVELESLDALKSKERAALAEREAAYLPTSFDSITSNLPNRHGGAYVQIFPEEQNYNIPDNAKFLLAVGHADLPPKIIEEYNAWYNTEHIPSYVDIPGFINARRFQIAKGKAGLLPGAQLPAPDFIALYDLANGEVFETEEFKQRSSTPWSTRIRQWTWDRRKMNNMYRCTYIAKQ